MIDMEVNITRFKVPSN